jgi:hypothetical protein
MDVCGFNGCGREVLRRGYCLQHYRQDYKGIPLRPLKLGPLEKTLPCSFSGCDRLRQSKGYCKLHAKHLRKGIPLAPITKRGRKRGTPPVIEFDVNERGCHIYRGKISLGGYGLTTIRRRTVMIHKYVWEKVNGPIPDGMMLDHICRNMEDKNDIRHRACCNVDHLRVVTPQVNATENSFSVAAINKAKTHCKWGHEFTPENTYPEPTGGRKCRACRRRSYVEYRKRKKLVDSSPQAPEMIHGTE